MAGTPQALSSPYGNSPTNLPNPVPEQGAQQTDNQLQNQVTAAMPNVSAMGQQAAAGQNPMTPDLNAPTPQAAPGGADALLGQLDSADSLLGQLDGTPAAPEKKSWYDVSAKGVGRVALDSLPLIGGIGGAALAGAGTFGVGAVGGAAAGGMAGYSLKKSIESALGINQPQTRSDFYKGVASEGAQQGVNEMGGQVLGGAVKVASKALPAAGKYIAEANIPFMSHGEGVPKEAIKTYMDSPQSVKAVYDKFGGDTVKAADDLRSVYQTHIQSAVSDLEKPTMDVIAKGATNLSASETGDAVKQLITGNVKAKYGPFQQAYGDLNQINRAVPIQDEARKQFGDKLVNWATSEFPESSTSYNAVKKFKDSFQASNTGAQFENVLKDLSDEISTAYRAGETNKAQVLSGIKSRATDFIDGQVGKLADRVSAGTASADEQNVISQMMQQRGIQDDPQKYAKSIASDFLKSKDTVKQNYGPFKEFMGDVMDQTHVKGKGTLDWLGNLSDVDPAKLAEGMSNPKQVQNLTKMKAQQPEVFNQIRGYQVQQLAKKSVTDGQLDATKFFDNVQGLHKEVRNLMFTPEEQASMKAVAENPKLKRINELTGEMNKGLIKPDTDHAALLTAGTRNMQDNRGLRQLGELSQLTGMNMVRPAQNLGAMNSMFGKGASRATAVKAAADVARGAARAAPGIKTAVQAMQPGRVILRKSPLNQKD